MSKIYEILSQIHDDVDFQAVSDFLDQGVLDSFDIMTLVELLEDEFSIAIGGKDIVPENFQNVEAIENLVKKYGGSL